MEMLPAKVCRTAPASLPLHSHGWHSIPKLSPKSRNPHEPFPSASGGTSSPRVFLPFPRADLCSPAARKAAFFRPSPGTGDDFGLAKRPKNGYMTLLVPLKTQSERDEQPPAGSHRKPEDVRPQRGPCRPGRMVRRLCCGLPFPEGPRSAYARHHGRNTGHQPSGKDGSTHLRACPEGENHMPQADKGQPSRRGQSCPFPFFRQGRGTALLPRRFTRNPSSGRNLS